MAEDLCEQQPLDHRVDTRPPHARVEQRSADFCTRRLVRVDNDRGDADCMAALSDRERHLVAIREPGPDDLVQGDCINRRASLDVCSYTRSSASGSNSSTASAGS